MKTDDFDFDLDESLIAQHPIKNRDESRLMVMSRSSGEISHKKFYDIIDYLNPGDVLVLNDTRVIPARLFGNRPGKDEKIEVLLVQRGDDDVWETLVKPGKKMKLGAEIIFGDGLLKGEVVDISDEGNRFVKFYYDGIFEEILDELGNMPLPPYITEKLEDKERYQTVYAKHEGSAAAPTAGLHFTKELLKKIEQKGVIVKFVTLHVGLGTFRPVKVDDVEKHNMHSEMYIMPKDTADAINEAKKNGNNLIAVGTTCIRTLESVYKKHGDIREDSGWTDIFIYPGFEFKVVDGIITNFHLPKSTLIMLIAAFTSKDIILNAYNDAVSKKYRFFSFGDAMFIKRD